MSWKESDRMSLRKEFVSLAVEGGICFSELCRRFGVSRKTGYKWVNRNKHQKGLSDLSSVPKTFPTKSSKKIESQVVELRIKQPTWGGRKIYHRLTRLGVSNVPAPSTITNILHRHHLISEDAKRTQTYIRFEREKPNELWQMDFKGYFKFKSGQRCDPLTLLDDHSRFNLCLKSCGSQTREVVQNVLIDVFRRYGLPWQMTMDNGSPWGNNGEYTKLAVWLMKLKIEVSHSRPYHPQTQGKLELFHRTLKSDVLQFRTFDNHEMCQQFFDKFRYIYNHERPHEGIKNEVPSKRYQSSHRAYPDKLLEPEYDINDKVLKVRSQGALQYKGKDYFIGKAFIGEHVAIKVKDSGGFYVNFGSFKIKEFI